jgi:hypothetical protein
MKKNILQPILMAGIICSVLFSLTACKNKINTNTMEEDSLLSKITPWPDEDSGPDPDNTENAFDITRAASDITEDAFNITEDASNITEVASDMEETAVEASIKADLDGDGNHELVEVILKSQHTTNSSGDEIELRIPYLRVSVSGKIYEALLGNSGIYGTEIFLLDLEDTKKQAVIIAFDVGGSGMGHVLLYAIHFEDGLKFLPLPALYSESIEELGGSFGLPAAGKAVDSYSVRIEYEDTGFEGHIPLDKKLSPIALDSYDSEGRLLRDTEIKVSAICDVNKIGKHDIDYVEIAQYIYGPNPSNGIGFLISKLRWVDGELEISDQECIPFTEADN